jgi:hypothetical protein
VHHVLCASPVLVQTLEGTAPAGPVTPAGPAGPVGPSLPWRPSLPSLPAGPGVSTIESIRAFTAAMAATISALSSAICLFANNPASPPCINPAFYALDFEVLPQKTQPALCSSATHIKPAPCSPQCPGRAVDFMIGEPCTGMVVKLTLPGGFSVCLASLLPPYDDSNWPGTKANINNHQFSQLNIRP